MPTSESSYRWVIVAAGGLLGCIAIGAMFSLPVFLRPMAAATGWSMTGVSIAMTIAFITMALASFAWGSLSDRVGPRAVVVIGSVSIAGSVALASQAKSLFAFQLIFGLLVGGSVAAIFAPLMAAVTGWFETRRSLAVSLVSAGIGMAPMTMSPLAAWLVTHYDWRTSMLVIAAIVAAVMIPLSLLIRRPPALESGEPMPDEPQSEISIPDAIRSPQFIILTLTNFFCCATHSGPIFHTVSYAVSCGIPLMAAVTIYSVEGFAGLFGRIAFGIAGDRLGAKRVLVFGLLVQAVGTLGYLFARQIGTFYAVAAMFGFIYAGTMPLYAVIARENFPLRMMGMVIGGTTMAGGLGMATGPVVGGMIYDHFHTYSWLFVTCFALGIGAFLIALTFRPFPKQDGVAVAA
jgi:MFS family permease